MNGIKVTVMHPDFEDNEDNQRAGLLEGMEKGWADTMATEGLDMPFVGTEDEAGVHVWFSYDQGVKRAESGVAVSIAFLCLGVLQLNRAASDEIMASYSFAIERDVPAMC